MIFLLIVIYADDVSSAWLVWSRAAEAALADAYRFSGGPIPSRGFVLGCGRALFRVVRLGGRNVRKVRGNVSDVVDGAGVFLFVTLPLPLYLICVVGLRLFWVFLMP